MISVGQARLVRLPYLREKLGIPKIIKRDPSQMPAGAKKGFTEAVRECKKFAKLMRILLMK